jgi:hypothetical protein
MYPHYPRWSYENAWDPDSDAFFKDAVYEAFVPALPLEPVTPVESSDGSSLDFSGRGTPAEMPPVPGQISPSTRDMELWLESASTGSNVAAVSSLPPVPTPRRHSTSELRRGVPPQPHFVSSAAFERFYTRQLNRARDSQQQQQQQRFPAMATDGDSDADAPVTLRPEGVSLHTSEIYPIQLPSSQSRAAISIALQQQRHHPHLARPITPPSTSPPSVQVLSATPGREVMQPSPPPSVSPRIYNWTAAAHSVPESPTLPPRIRVTPARWPVY